MKTKSLVMILIMMGWFSCDNSTGPEPISDVHGLISDSSGEPIAEALIECSFHLDKIDSDQNSNLHKISETSPVSQFNFSVPERDHILIWITKHMKTDTVLVLADQEFAPGSYSVAWNSRNSSGNLVTSGIYNFHLKSSSILKSQTFLVLNQYDHFEETNELEYFAKTDSRGNYTIAQQALFPDPDVIFDVTDSHGQRIGRYQLSRYIDIWVLHQDYITAFIDSVYVDEAEGTMINFTLQSK